MIYCQKRTVIFLTDCFKSDDFQIEYTESEICNSVIWESHCHARFELIAVMDGDITVMLEGQKYRLQKNQIIIIPPLLYHSITANEEGSYRRITALFGNDTIPTALWDSITKQERSTMTSAIQLEKIKRLCQKSDQTMYVPLMHSFIIELFYDALQVSGENITVETDEFLQKALSYIDEHLHEKILLDDLARATSHSKSSFCHSFEKKMRISPKQYILQKKLALASKLIAEGTPRTVAAMRVGYENYSNFFRIYSKHTDISTPQKTNS